MSEILIKPLGEAEQNVVAMLEETLAQAKRGAFHSIGIVVCMKTGYSHAMTGTAAADLHMGCASLQRAILSEVEDGNRKRGPSNIVRAR